MFWIGLIVGIVITIVITLGLIVACFKITGTTYDEYRNAQDTVATAITNRESEMVIVHNGETIASCVFEER